MATFRPGKPRRLLTLSGNYTPGAASAPVIFDTVDEEGEWEATSDGSETVVAVAGLYLVTSSLHRGTPGSGQVLSAIIDVNGANVSQNAQPSSAGAGSSVAPSWVGELEQGDTVALIGLGAGTGVWQAAGTHLSLVRIGPVRWT